MHFIALYAGYNEAWTTATLHLMIRISCFSQFPCPLAINVFPDHPRLLCQGEKKKRKRKSEIHINEQCQ